MAASVYCVNGLGRLSNTPPGKHCVGDCVGDCVGEGVGAGGVGVGGVGVGGVGPGGVGVFGPVHVTGAAQCP